MHCIRTRFFSAALVMGLSCLAQTAASEEPTDPEPPVRHAARLAWGAGLLHYKEPGLMRLSGPEVTLQAQYQPENDRLPDRLRIDLGGAVVNYDSLHTGSLPHRAALNGRGTALWRLPSLPGTWHAGVQIDLAWTDLRGTSDTGHRGYRRLGSKAWAVVQHESAEGIRLEAAILLRGRQDTLLSDVGGPDITNTQRKGYCLAWQHTPLAGVWQAPRPWARLSQVSRSDNDGIYYEPRNRTLQLGLLFDF